MPPIRQSKAGSKSSLMSKTSIGNGAKSLVFALLCIWAGALGSYFPLKRHFKAELEAMKPEVIEVIIRDTLRVHTPVYRDVIKIRRDTIKVSRNDTIVRGDTVYLPKVQKYYEEEDYRAWVSGYEPNLDSLYVYPKTITKTAIRKEWRKFDYGLQAGVGVVLPAGSVPGFGGYVGFGFTWHF